MNRNAEFVSYVPCLDCGGTGKVICPWCDGSTFLGPDRACDGCYEGHQSCWECEGTGVTYANRI